MNSEQFESVVMRQLAMCSDVLVAKAKEYATQDRLHNFKAAAHIEGITVRQALAGMMAKHTVSIYDMCRSEERFEPAQWMEKITDHMNYLILLKAIVLEESQTATLEAMFPDTPPYSA